MSSKGVMSDGGCSRVVDSRLWGFGRAGRSVVVSALSLTASILAHTYRIGLVCQQKARAT